MWAPKLEPREAAVRARRRALRGCVAAAEGPWSGRRSRASRRAPAGGGADARWRAAAPRWTHERRLIGDRPFSRIADDVDARPGRQDLRVRQPVRVHDRRRDEDRHLRRDPEERRHRARAARSPATRSSARASRSRTRSSSATGSCFINDRCPARHDAGRQAADGRDWKVVPTRVGAARRIGSGRRHPRRRRPSARARCRRGGGRHPRRAAGHRRRRRPGPRTASAIDSTEAKGAHRMNGPVPRPEGPARRRSATRSTRPSARSSTRRASSSGPAVAEFEEASPPTSAARTASGSTPARRPCTWRCSPRASGPATRSSPPRSPSSPRRWAISYVGATPVFVDVDPATGTSTRPPSRRRSRRGPRRSCPVHLYGQPADLGAVRADRPSGTASRSSRTPPRRTARDATTAGAAGTLRPAAASASTRARTSVPSARRARVVTDDDGASPIRLRRLRDHAQDGRHHHVEIGLQLPHGRRSRARCWRSSCGTCDAWTEGAAGGGRAVPRAARRHRRCHAAGRWPTASNPPGTSTPSGSTTATGCGEAAGGRRRHRRPLPDARSPPAGVRTPRPSARSTSQRRGASPATCLSLPMFAELTADSRSTSPSSSDIHDGRHDVATAPSWSSVVPASSARHWSRHLAADGPVRVLDDLSTGRRTNIDGVDGVDLVEACPARRRRR